VRLPGAINGWWASDDGLTLIRPGRRPVRIVPPTPKSWDGMIIAVRGVEEDGRVAGALWAMPTGGPFEGTITGTVTGPEGNPFSDVDEHISVPVTVTPVPASWWTGWRTLVWLHRLVIVATGILAGSAVYYLVRKVRRFADPAYRPNERALPTAGAAVACGPLVGLGVGLALRLPVPELGDRAIVPPESLLIAPILLGIAVMAVMLNAALTPDA
jgi:hypothetical protein